MERYVAFSLTDGVFVFDGDASRHFGVVRRGKIGDKMEAVFGDRAYLAEAVSLDPLKARMIGEIGREKPALPGIYVAFSLLRGNRHDFILQKGTELGAKGFYPFVSHRSVVRFSKGEESQRRQRMEKIVASSLEQCRRDDLPIVHEPLAFDELVGRPFDGNRIIADEGLRGEPSTLLGYLSSHKGNDLLVLIGPEGGFERYEVEKAVDSGFEAVSLGKNILRAETAAIYCCSLFAALEEG